MATFTRPNRKLVSMSYAMTVTTKSSFADTVTAVREALDAQGFGILTEIDIQATLRSKLDVETPPQVILGACRPTLAHRALEIEPSVGLLLPCNVVVRALDDDNTVVESLDPAVMVSLTGNDALRPIAEDASQRLTAALGQVAG